MKWAISPIARSSGIPTGGRGPGVWQLRLPQGRESSLGVLRLMYCGIRILKQGIRTTVAVKRCSLAETAGPRSESTVLIGLPV